MVDTTRIYGAQLRKGDPTRVVPVQVAGVIDKKALRKVLLIGDSIAANLFDQAPTVSSVTNNGDGTATIAFASSHNFSIGQNVYVNNSPSLTYNTYGAPVTAQVNSGKNAWIAFK